MDGDVACLKMCMDRIIPAHKAVEIKHENQDMAINIVVESIGEAVTGGGAFGPTTNALSHKGYNVIDSRVGIVDADVVESEDGDF